MRINKIFRGSALRIAVGFIVSILLLLAGSANALDGGSGSSGGGGFDIRGPVVSVHGSLNDFTLRSWDASNFAGFWYDLKDDLKTERLQVLSVNNRIIDGTSGSEQLVYQTWKTNRTLKVIQNGKASGSDADLSRFGNGTNGKYDILGWQGEPFIAVNGNAKKLSKLVIEQGNASSDKKTLASGETWDIGGGWTLTAQSIDAAASPRFVHLNLSKNGTYQDDAFVSQGDVYVYIASNLANESDVPLFLTYVDSIFSGTTGDLVQLRYTWAISTPVIEINSGLVYGNMEVTSAGSDSLVLKNKDRSVDLIQGETVEIMGDLEFRVADNGTDLRYYPMVNITQPGTYELRGSVVSLGTYSDFTPRYWDASNLAGFWYDLKDNLMTETLQVLSVNSRNIGSEQLIYRTDKTIKILKVAENGHTSTELLNAFPEGRYNILGWQGGPFIAVKGNAKKLSRLIIEQGNATSDNMTLSVGESWNLGDGWNLTAYIIDASSSPRKVWLNLSKDGIKLNDSVIEEGGILVYSENLAGETNVPLFTTYVDSIFPGASSDMVRLRYTWAISKSVKEIHAGDIFGNLEVTTASSNFIELKNKDKSVDLIQGGTVDIMGDLKFRVADSSGNLRYYPFINKTVGISIPIVEITNPPDNTSILQGEMAILTGSVSGSFFPNISWTSSIDGFIGNASRISTFSLSPGAHVITLTVRDDSRGMMNSSSINLTVLPVTHISPGVEVRGSVVSIPGSLSDPTPHYWDASNFAIFWYDLKDDLKTERLQVLSVNNRIIDGTSGSEQLVYQTSKTNKTLKVIQNGKANPTDPDMNMFNYGRYDILGWQGEPFIAVKGNARKLSRLVIEQGNATAEKKTLMVGETWNIGDGWTLKTQDIDAAASPRQVHLNLSKNGIYLDDAIVAQGDVYVYTAASLAGESNVPLFVTYVDSIFAGGTGDMVQVRYTWAISTPVIEINSGDVYGNMEVTTAGSSFIELKNKDKSVDLTQGGTVDIMGDLKFRVADNSTDLRYYPMVVRTQPGIYEVRGEVVSVIGTTDPTNRYWDASNLAGFWYDLKDNFMTETLQVNGVNSRNIGAEQLIYRTDKTTKILKVVENGHSSTELLDKFPEGRYNILGWQGEPFIAVKGNARKLSHLIIEQGNATSDNMTLSVGESWNLGDGWNLTPYIIDASSPPKKVWFNLSKDGIKLNDSVIEEGGILVYSENLAGETNVPLFTTYVDSIFHGASTNMIRLRYTWAISKSIVQVNAGDLFGNMEVTIASSNFIELKNKDKSVDFVQGGTVDIMGDLKFKVADSSANLRYYPFITKTAGISLPIVEIANPPDNSSVPKGEMVVLSGSASGSLFPNYSWTSSIDGFIGNGQRISTFSLSPGIHSVTLTVKDATGLTNSTSMIINVNPVITTNVAGEPATGPMTWNASNFPGFWHDIISNLKTETLNTASIIGRDIPENQLWYNTTKTARTLKVVQNGKQNMDVNISFQTPATGKYEVVGWMGRPYVAVKGNARKLSSLVIEQGNASSDKKILAMGEYWDVGDGWTLAAQSIDSKALPRQVWFSLSKDGFKLDDKVIGQGDTYVYVEKSFAGERDVPLFLTYVDIVASDSVQLRYTWAISKNVIDFRPGDKIGLMTVTTASDSNIQLRNRDNAITLARGATINIADGLRFKVNDTPDLQYYPEMTVITGLPSGTPVESSTGKGTVIVNTDMGTVENLTAVNVSDIPEPPPAAANLYYGLFRFNITGLSPGGSANITMTFPNNLPAGTTYWKYGANATNTTPHWYTIPSTVDGNELTIMLTDGGDGDDDLAANGNIRDDGGPSILQPIVNNISSCTTISSPGTYMLNQSIINSTMSFCINITSSDVYFDGAGFIIDGVNTGDAGVYVHNLTTALVNVTVKNLKVTDWGNGIYYVKAANGRMENNIVSNNSNGTLLESSRDNTLISNNASNNYIGIILYDSSNNNTLSGNTANSNGLFGILLVASSNNNTLRGNNASNNDIGINFFPPGSNNNTLNGNTASNNTYGIILSDSNSNTIYNNYFNNTNNAQDNGNNIWNIIKTAGTNIIGGSWLGGNYWSDYAGVDTDGDGLGNTLLPYNSSGITYGGDYLPLVTPIAQPGTPVESSTGKGIVYIDIDAGTVENLTAVNVSDIPEAPPAGADLYYGLFRFNITGLSPGGSANITLAFPNNLPAGTAYWKYGANATNTTPHWYTIPSTIDGNKLTVMLTDGGDGDDDLAVNGNIRDDSGPSIPQAAVTLIDSCTTISEPGEYMLNNSIVDSASITCISITSDNIVFDGAGYTIASYAGSTFGTIGIHVNSSTNALTNITVKNLKVMYWTTGIAYENAQNGSIINNTASLNHVGIGLYFSSNNSLTGNIASSNTDGIDLGDSSNNNNLTGNIASLNSNNGIYIYISSNNILNRNTASSNNNTGFILSWASNNNLTGNIASSNDNNGIYFIYSSNNILSGNTASSNGNEGIYLSYPSNDNNFYNNFFNNTINFGGGLTSGNTWNITKASGINIVGGPDIGGNFWANPSGTGFSQTCTDSDSDGICDSSYMLDSNNIDYLPLAVTAAPPTGAPDITSFSPLTSTVMDNVGASRTFNIIINQTVNISWQINGTEVFNETGVTTSSYTNTSAAQGAWNITAFASNTNGTDAKMWEWIVTAAAAPNITNFNPPAPIVPNNVGETRTFNITVNQTVDVTWYLNGTAVSSDSGVTTSSYTNTSAAQGSWNVTAVASNANGTDAKMWEWIVTPPPLKNTVSGFVINDINGNGKQDAGETGLPGWNIRLIGLGIGTAGINKVTVTDSRGFYIFENLHAGSYMVTETMQGGYIMTGASVKVVTLEEGKNAVANFTNRPLSSLFNFPMLFK